MNAIVVNAVYPPEPVVSAQMGQDIALQLTQSGARVIVLCPYPTRPFGTRSAARMPVDVPRTVIEDGVEVVRLPSFTSPESRWLARMRESFSFGQHACGYIEQHRADVDVVYANTWPVLSQLLLARYCSKRGIPFVLHIQDLYPESLLVKLPGFVRRLVTAPLTAVDRWTVRRAARVVVISDNMRRTYVEGRGLAPEKVVTVLNWVDESRFTCLPTREEACARYGVPTEKFTFLYLGNIGPVAGVEGLIKAFHAARLAQAQLVIAGDGSAKAACMELASRLGVNGARFISDPEAAHVPLLQSLADVCLLPLRKGAGMSSIPSKLMAYLLSAKPVLATLDAESETAQCIREAECGWVGESQNIDWLAGKMGAVAVLPADVLKKIGARGKEYGLKHFSRSAGVERVGKVICDALRL